MVGIEAYLSIRRRNSDTGLSFFDDDDEESGKVSSEKVPFSFELYLSGILVAFKVGNILALCNQIEKVNLQKNYLYCKFIFSSMQPVLYNRFADFLSSHFSLILCFRISWKIYGIGYRFYPAMDGNLIAVKIFSSFCCFSSFCFSAYRLQL